MKKKIINIVVILIISVCMLMVGAKAATTILSSTVTYKDTTVEKALDELMEIAIQCSGKDYDLCTKAKVGDYVSSYYPNNNSFTIPASLTGYDTDQTINPSELSLWRIIAINADATIDMVSEYTSSTPVYFKGETGIKNYVATLNYIAGGYISSEGDYTKGARHMGYNGQLPVLSTSFTASNMYMDSLYTRDINLVESALGTLKAYAVGTTFYYNYWLASRYYYLSSGTDYLVGRVFSCSDDEITYSRNMYSNNSAAINPNGVSAFIHPIIILKANTGIISSRGDGTSSNPWQID